MCYCHVYTHIIIYNTIMLLCIQYYVVVYTCVYTIMSRARYHVVPYTLSCCLVYTITLSCIRYHVVVVLYTLSCCPVYAFLWSCICYLVILYTQLLSYIHYHPVYTIMVSCKHNHVVVYMLYVLDMLSCCHIIHYHVLCIHSLSCAMFTLSCCRVCLSCIYDICVYYYISVVTLYRANAGLAPPSGGVSWTHPSSQ